MDRIHERKITRRLWPAALLLATLAPALGPAAGARAGVVLLSRQSSLQATGNAPGSGQDNFNLTGGTTTFSPFSNDLNNNTDATSPALADAHQYSVPGTSAAGLQGAYAEGTVQAELNAPRSSARAKSVFDLTFQVTRVPARYNFGGAFGSAGNGTAAAELMNVPAAGAAGDARPVFAATVGGGPDGQDASRTLSRQGILAPGVYGLKIWADAPGTLSNSSAYYTVNLMLSATGVGSAPGGGAGMPAAAPMPPAAWPGLVMLAGLAVLARRARRRGVA